MTFGATLDVIHNVDFHFGPPIVSFDQLRRLTNPWMAIYRRVVAGFDNGTLRFHRAGDDASSLFIPYIVDPFQFVWVDPWFEGFLFLFFLFISDRDCSYEYVVREHYNVFVVACALVVVWSSGQRVSSAVGLSWNMTYLEIEFH